MAQYVPPREVKKRIGVVGITLKEWAESGYVPYIVTPGGKRLYDISRIIESGSTKSTEKNGRKEKICYCRVSSTGQKDDLERQIEFMRSEFPNHKIVTDIGSGINFKRKGLLNILELGNRQLISEVVIAHRDRLCRFAFELIEWILLQNGVKLVVLNGGMDSPNSELAEDLLSIVHVFNCRMQGRRKYKTKEKSSIKEDDKEAKQLQSKV